MYQDNTAPSTEHPVADSVRIATARVRQKSNNIAQRVTHARSFEKLRSGSPLSLRTLGRKGTGSRPVTPEKAVSPVEEVPETSFDMDDESPRMAQRTGPYMHPGRTVSGSGLDVNSRTTLLTRTPSPLAGSSQMTVANPIAQPVDSTVRLVSEHERIGHVRRAESSTTSKIFGYGPQDSRPSSPGSGSGSSEELFESDKNLQSQRSWPQARQEPGRSRTPISDVLSAYYQESVHLGDARESASKGQQGIAKHPKEDMSWTLLLFLLSSVTVVSPFLWLTVKGML